MPHFFVSLRARLFPRVPLAGEVWGGLAAMLVALPSAIAFGVAIYGVLGPAYVGRGAAAGILGVIAIGLVTSALGGAPRLISAPCAPAAAIMSALAANLVQGLSGLGSPVTAERAIVFLVLVGLLCGLLQAVYGLLGGGRLIKYIPYPVVSGYLSGVGILIIVTQIPKLLGVSGGGSVADALMSPERWRWPGVVVGVVTILGVAGGPRLTRKVPAPILGLAAGLVTYFLLALSMPELLRLEGNKLLVGTVSAGGDAGSSSVWGWEQLATFRWPEVRLVLVSAFMLSLLLSIDTLKTCVVLDAITRSRHHSNRELLAQGAGNVVSALLGGIPGAGTMGATLVNVNSGAQTRLSGVLEGAFAVLALLAFGRAMGWLPIGALAGLLMVVATRMIDLHSLKLLRRKSTVLDFVVTLAVVIVAVAWNLVAAAGVGLVLAILLFIREQMRGSVVRRKATGQTVSSKRQRTQAEREVLRSQGDLITVCELQGSLFFGTTDRLFTELEGDLARCRCLILDMRRVQSVDYTAVHLLKQMESMMSSRDAHLVLSNLPAHLPTGRDLEVYFGEVGLVKSSRKVRVFDALDEAMEWAEDLLLLGAMPSAHDEGCPLDLAEFDLFRGMQDPGVLTVFRELVEEQSIRAGETLFRDGEAGDQMYLVRRGLVRVALPVGDHRHLTLATVPQGSFFGEMSFLDRGVRSADAFALKDSDFYVLSRERFKVLSRSNPDVCVAFYARLARTLAARLRQTDRELRSLMES